MRKPPVSLSKDPRSPTQRSGVTNGTRLFVDGRERSSFGRRYRDLMVLHLADFNGLANATDDALIRRAVTLQIQLEQVESAASRGVAIDLEAYSKAAGILRRLLHSLEQARAARFKALKSKSPGETAEERLLRQFIDRRSTNGNGHGHQPRTRA